MSLDLLTSAAGAAQQPYWGVQFYTPQEALRQEPAPVSLPPLPRPLQTEAKAPTPTEPTKPAKTKRGPGRPPIVDEFTGLKLSRQRKWQLRKAAQGLCVLCGKPTTGSNHCLEHMEKNRDSNARRFGFKRQYENCKSRKIKQRMTGEAGKQWTQKAVVSVRELGLTEIDQQRDYLAERGLQGWELVRAEVRADDIIWHLCKTISVPQSL